MLKSFKMPFIYLYVSFLRLKFAEMKKEVWIMYKNNNSENFEFKTLGFFVLIVTEVAQGWSALNK